MSDIKSSARYHTSGTILSALGGLFLLLGVIALFLGNGQWAILLTILTIILGNSAITHFEKAAECKPASPIVPSLEYFSASLKHGDPCTILLDLQYPIEDHNIHTLERVRARVQRALNIALAEVEELPPNPYVLIDAILQAHASSIANEIGLTKLDLKAINIQTKPKESTPGIFLRE